MKTMLEPRMVAASVQRRCAFPHFVDAGFRELITPSSQGALSKFILCCLETVHRGPASQHPVATIGIIRRRAFGKPRFIFLVTLVPVFVTSIGRAKLLVRNRAQMIFDLVHVPRIEAPIVAAEVVQTR